ncbi:hypothetical protein BH20VER2_BH20VER2_03140 [soil metagenome]|nr:VapC toxin family PIN domain ribonuclease [Chthoniobacterales bacterium]
MTWLLDGNVLVALAVDTHEFHRRAHRWFDSLAEPFATCAVTEGTLLRVHMKVAADSSALAAWTALAAIHVMRGHVFWEDGFSYSELTPHGIRGSSQVTDAWLSELARRRGGKLATLDIALAAEHPDVGLLIPT